MFDWLKYNSELSWRMLEALYYFPEKSHILTEKVLTLTKDYGMGSNNFFFFFKFQDPSNFQTDFNLSVLVTLPFSSITLTSKKSTIEELKIRLAKTELLSDTFDSFKELFIISIFKFICEIISR